MRRLRALVARSDWYREFSSAGRPRGLERVVPSIRKRRHPADGLWLRGVLYEAFETLLAEGAVALAPTGPDWDAERVAVDRVVIHHTRRPPGIRTSLLDAMHLLRLYVRHYNEVVDRCLAPVPPDGISSGHHRGTAQVFWGYHWLVRTDGSAERLLRDDETGWHAGAWALNCRSVAICIDDDLSTKPPAPDALQGVARVIEEHYSAVDVSPTTLLGHGEVQRRSSCPGGGFLAGWKADLLATLGA